MSTVTIHLSVRYAAMFGTHELWERRVEMDHLPNVGDTIDLTPADEDGDGIAWPVKRRYWRHDGTTVLELAVMQVNPDQAAKEACNGTTRIGHNIDGGESADAMLRAAGWRAAQ
jgi:hypothetical protein